MKSGKPLVLVVNRCGTVKRSLAGRRVRQQSHLRLVAAEGVQVARVAALGAGQGSALATKAPAPAVSPVPVSPVPVSPVPVSPVPVSLRSTPVSPPAKSERRPPSLSRPFGRRVVQAANDVAVLALALLSGLRPRA